MAAHGKIDGKDGQVWVNSNLVNFFTHQTVFAKEVYYILEDRDRLIRVETKIEMIDNRFEMMEKRFEQIYRRFEQVDNRLDRLENVMMRGVA